MRFNLSTLRVLLTIWNDKQTTSFQILYNRWNNIEDSRILEIDVEMYIFYLHNKHDSNVYYATATETR